MFKTKFFLIFFIMFKFSGFSISQNIQLDKNFRFSNGIFLSFEQVKTNSPIPISNIITNLDKKSFNFFEILFQQDEILIVNLDGNKQKVKKQDIWGYADNGFLYINQNNYFSQITVLGAICHFVATEEVRTVSTTYYETFNSSGVSLVNYQAILDFETGKVYALTVNNLSIILSRDTEIYKEWTELSKRKQKKQMFIFIQKYNNKNPVYIQKIEN